MLNMREGKTSFLLACLKVSDVYTSGFFFSKRTRSAARRDGSVQMNDSGIDNDVALPGWLSSVDANGMWHARRISRRHEVPTQRGRRRRDAERS